MFNLLFARTFLVVGGMLIITTITSRLNKYFESSKELWATVIGTFVFLFAIIFFADIYPLNLILVAIFSALIGWQIGPTIIFFGREFQMRKFLKSRGVEIKKGQPITNEQRSQFASSFDSSLYHQQWHNVVSQALLATTFATFSAVGIVFLTSIDFSFLGGFLFISLILLVAMGLLNLFFFHSKILSLIKAYVGAVIFTLYLIYDFNRLEKMATDESWRAAIDIAVNIYLDIINLFINLLEILADSDS